MLPDHPSGQLCSIFDLLFSDEVVSALRECGIDNFMTYLAEIYNLGDDRVYKNYKAVNIIGLVAAADMSASENIVHGSPLIDVDFDSLTIDPEKARDFVFFRLAECVSGIVVQESVKQYFDDKEIKGIDWVFPEDWMG